MTILMNVSYALGNNVYSVVVGHEFSISQSRWLMLFYSFVLFLGILPVVIEIELKSPNMIMDLFISPFRSVKFCFLYFEAIWLDVYTFRIVTSSS